MPTIQQLRKQNHLSQKHLAGMMEMSPSKLAQWEHAQDLPNSEQVDRLAFALGTDRALVIAAFVATMTELDRVPPAVEWYAEVWYGPCWLLLSEREDRRRRFVAQIKQRYRPKPLSGLDILIDRACGIE